MTNEQRSNVALLVLRVEKYIVSHIPVTHYESRDFSNEAGGIWKDWIFLGVLKTQLGKHSVTCRERCRETAEFYKVINISSIRKMMALAKMLFNVNLQFFDMQNWGLMGLKGQCSYTSICKFIIQSFLLWTTCSYNCNVVPSFLLTFKAAVKFHVKNASTLCRAVVLDHRSLSD